MEEENKSKRSPNFGAEEKATLIGIIADKYSSILENKKTDQTSGKEKIRAWKNIEKDFNSVSPSGCFRNWEVLKRYYENQKKIARQVKAKEILEKFKTGGGPEVKVKKDLADDLLLSVINKKTIEGLGNTRDSNRLSSFTQGGEATFLFELEEANGIDEVNSQQESSTEAFVIAENINNQQLSGSGQAYGIAENESKQTWRKPADLQTPLNPLLQQNTPKRKEALSSRRRPKQPITTLTSSHFSAKYNILLDRRLQLVEKQIQQIEDEKAFQAEERRLKLESIKLDIELKKKQLSKYT